MNKMKPILAALFVAAFLSPWCFAQEETPAVTPETFTGRVASVSKGGSGIFPGADKKAKNKEGDKGGVTIIAVENKKEERISFRAPEGTPVTDPKGKSLQVGEIKYGDTITVTYTTDTKKETHQATNIKLLKRRSMFSKVSSLFAFGGGKSK